MARSLLTSVLLLICLLTGLTHILGADGAKEPVALDLQTSRTPPVFSAADTHIELEAIFTLHASFESVVQNDPHLSFNRSHPLLIEYMFNEVMLMKTEMPPVEWIPSTQRWESVLGISQGIPDLRVPPETLYRDVLIQAVLATESGMELTARLLVRLQSLEVQQAESVCMHWEPRRSALGLNESREVVEVHNRVFVECGCSSDDSSEAGTVLLAAELIRVIAPQSIIQVNDSLDGTLPRVWCALEAVLCTFSLQMDTAGNILFHGVKLFGALCDDAESLRHRESRLGMLSWAAEEPVNGTLGMAALVIVNARGLGGSEVDELLQRHLVAVVDKERSPGALLCRGLNGDGWAGLWMSSPFAGSKVPPCGQSGQWLVGQSYLNLAWDVFVLPGACQSGEGGAAVILPGRGIQRPVPCRSWCFGDESVWRENECVPEPPGRVSSLRGASREYGGKWNVPAVYINVDAQREDLMQRSVAALNPRAPIRRFAGKVGGKEHVCQWFAEGTFLEQDGTPETVCTTLSHWLAIRELFSKYPREDFFVVLEDDVSFDLVPFWPGTLRTLLEHASQTHPGWQILNLAPSNDAARQLGRWTHGEFYHPFSYSKPGKANFEGAIAYAVRRDVELEELVGAAAACADPLHAKAHLAVCRTMLHAHADGIIYHMTAAMGVTMPLLRINTSLRSVRKQIQPINPRHVQAAENHLTQWLFLNWLSQVQ
jgi:hypothetical protein